MDAKELAKMLEGWPEGARPLSLPVWCETPGGCAYNEGACTESEKLEIDTDLACMSGLRWLMKQKSGSLLADPKRKYHVSCEPETLFRVVLSDRGGPCVSLAFPHDDYYVNELETDHTGPTILHAIDAAIKATKDNQ